MTPSEIANNEATALAQGWIVQRGVKAGGRDRWISPCKSVFCGSAPAVRAIIEQESRGE